MIIPAMRGSDAQGKGYFGAPRGDRTHKGTDFVAQPGEPVRAFLAGTVTKLGYPYADKLEFRYVQVTRPNGDHCRYYYVAPTVAVGDQIAPGEMLGTCQDLPYDGRAETTADDIINHYHLECVVRGEHVDPVRYLSDA